MTKASAAPASSAMALRRVCSRAVLSNLAGSWMYSCVWRRRDGWTGVRVVMARRRRNATAAHNVNHQAIVGVRLGHEQTDRGQEGRDVERWLPCSLQAQRVESRESAVEREALATGALSLGARARLRWEVENVQADATRRVNVWMVNGCDEVDFGRLERIARRDAQAELEATSCVRRPVRTLDHCSWEGHTNCCVATDKRYAHARHRVRASAWCACMSACSCAPASRSLAASSFIHALIPGEGSLNSMSSSFFIRISATPPSAMACRLSSARASLRPRNVPLQYPQKPRLLDR